MKTKVEKRGKEVIVKWKKERQEKRERMKNLGVKKKYHIPRRTSGPAVSNSIYVTVWTSL